MSIFTVSKNPYPILNAVLLLFCLPMAFPNYELSFILLQFGLLIPVYLFFNLFKTDLYGLVLLAIYFVLVGLLVLGLPGSIMGWMSMVCAGYFFGAKACREDANFLRQMKLLVLLAIGLSCWIVFKNHQNPFSFDRLSNYFESSSINTVSILIVCTGNLFCAVYYYLSFFSWKDNPARLVSVRKILYPLLATGMLCVVVFEFRSGLGIFFLTALVAWHTLRRRVGYLIYPCILIVLIPVIYLGKSAIYEAVVRIVAPGRTDLASIAAEIGGLRYERMVNFWETAAFSKMDMSSWSPNLSFSAMSDLFTAMFPLSIIFFLPALSLFKLIGYMNSKCRIPAIIILCAASSSFLISLLQPDFYSMFTFFAISSLVYFGERKKSRIRSVIRKNIQIA